MKYRVVFRERPDVRAGSPKNPVAFLEASHSQKIVRKAVFILRKEPNFVLSTDSLTDDEAFLGLGTETWEYDVVEGKDQDFKDALLNSGCMVEFTSI